MGFPSALIVALIASAAGPVQDAPVPRSIAHGLFCLVGNEGDKQPRRLNILLPRHPDEASETTPVLTGDPDGLLGSGRFVTFRRNQTGGYAAFIGSGKEKADMLLSMAPRAAQRGTFDGVLGYVVSGKVVAQGRCFGPAAPITEAQFKQRSAKR